MSKKEEQDKFKKIYKPVPFLNGLDEIKQDLIMRNKSGDITYGVEIIDDCVQYIRPSTVTLIMAVPNCGKSLLAQNIACHIAKQDKKVIFCSCEMTVGLLMERELKKTLAIDSKQLLEIYEKSPSLVDTMVKPMLNDKSYDYLKNISVLDIGGISITELLEVLDEYPDYEYVIVDYIQRVKGRGESEYEQLKDVSYTLQIYAMNSGKSIIECSQVPKTVESDSRSVKNGVDFTKLRAKGAGNPEEDAHVAIKMAEDISSTGERCVLINLSKNKYGSLKNITYRYKIDNRLNFVLLDKDI